MGRKLRHLLIFLLIILKEVDFSFNVRCPRAPSYSNKNLTSIPKSLRIPHNYPCLDLGSNLITNVTNQELTPYHNVRWLHLPGNQITVIQPGTFANLSQLQVLDLSCNRITMLHHDTFAGLSQLKLLYLSYNQIKKIQSGAFSNLPRLLGLDLDENRITEIQSRTFAKLPTLQVLSLIKNRITIIQSRAFANLSQLGELRLSKNQIKTIQSGVFINLPKLRSLDLSSNQITTIHTSVFANLSIFQCFKFKEYRFCPAPLFRLFDSPGQMNYLRYIKLGGNPWQCDCRMEPFRLILSLKHQIICTQPAKVQGKKLEDVKPEELVCEQLTISTLAPDIQVPTGQGQSQAIIKYNTHTTATVMASGHDQTGQGQSQAIIKYNTRTTGTIMASGNDQTGQGQSQATTESSTNTTATIMASGHDQTGQGQFQATTEPITNTTATVTFNIQVTSHNSHYHWYFRSNAVPTAYPADKTKTTLTSLIAITSDKPETAPSSLLPVLLGSVCGPVAGLIVLIGTITLTVWCKGRTRHPPIGRNPYVVGSNTNTSSSIIGTDHDQTGQGQSQANIQSLNAGKLSRGKVLAAFKPKTLHAGVEATPRDPTSTETTSAPNQTEQGHPESTTNTTAIVMVSVDYIGQGQSQAVIECNTHTTATAMASGHDQTGQGQSQANPESLDARNASYGTGPADSQLNSLYKTTTVMRSGHDQTGQGQSQANTDSLDGINLAYGRSPAVSQSKSLYKTTTVMTSGHNQTGQGQSLTKT